eukprot:c12878_g1_i1.p1 GENE.c12878_g1_i1~~c12878_g1_i1.p1  ORF type:complete len:625 (+),score=125.86 c12878_g1_i1:133-2007(+)
MFMDKEKDQPELECAICCCALTCDGENVPLLLSCGHSNCKRCLTRLAGASAPASQSIRCIVCRAQTRMTAGVDGLPRNDAVIAVIKQHTTECPPLSSTNSQKDLICGLHGKDFILFCGTCRKVVCAACAEGPCEWHTTQPITQARDAHIRDLQAFVQQLESFGIEIGNRFDLTAELTKEITQFSTKTIRTVKGIMERVRTAIDNKEKMLVEQINKECDAKAKTLDIQRSHLEMVERCVTAWIRSCKHTLAQAQAHLSTIRCVQECSEHITQARSLVGQCLQLCGVGCREDRDVGLVVTTSQMEQEADATIQRIENNMGAVLSCDNLASGLTWKASECVGLEGGSAIRLAWNDDNCHVIDHTENPKHQHGVEYSVRGWESRDESHLFDYHNGKTVLYKGPDKECVMRGLHEVRLYMFELTVVYPVPTNGQVQNVVVCARDDLCCVRTLESVPFVLPSFVEVDYGVVVSSDGMRVTNDNSTMNRYAISDVIERRDVVWWKVKVHTCSWILAGVISTNTKGGKSYSSKTSFGWIGSPSNKGWYRLSEDGKCSFEGREWEGWLSGDEAIMRLDFVHNTLAMKHSRSSTPFVMAVTPNLDWRIHVCMCYSNNLVEILSTSPHERFSLEK